MTRQAVRELKRQIAQRDWGATQDEATRQAAQVASAALALLARSVAFRHKRLAILRLEMAVRLNSEVPLEIWSYCRRIAQASQEPSLAARYFQAEKLSRSRLM